LKYQIAINSNLILQENVDYILRVFDSTDHTDSERTIIAMKIDQREQEFRHPTKSRRSAPFWAWNGKLNEHELLRQIDIMKEMGFSGFFMHSRTGLETEYLGEDWFRLINRCAEYAKEKGMDAWLYDEDRWPSGSAGGLATREKENRSMYLYMKICSDTEYNDREACPVGKSCVFSYRCFLQNSSYSGGRELHEGDSLQRGESALLFYISYSSNSEEYNGYTYLDTMSHGAVDNFIQLTHEAYQSSCDRYLGNAIKGIFTDEPHRGALFSSFSEGSENAVPYTPTLFEEFQKRLGYDLRTHLPELFLRKNGRDISKTARDYVELCQELFIENFAIPIHNWCQKNHMVYTGHVLHEDSLCAQTIMQGSLMRFYEHMDIPGVDVLGEFNECWWIVKQLASVAHQLKKGNLLSELDGCTGWQTSLRSYKNIGDWQRLFGINFRCPHISWYTMKGEAKRDYPASILHQSAWYSEYRYVEDYFARLNAVLDQSEPVCDLLVLNPIESVWARAYSGAFDVLSARDKKIRRLEEEYSLVFHSLSDNRIEFDYGDEDILARYARAENGMLFVGAACYRKVLIAGLDTVRATTAALLEKFSTEGGMVVFAGEPPHYMDAEPSTRMIHLADQTTLIPLQMIDIAYHCRNSMEPTVSGENRIFSQTRVTEDVKVIMFLNMNRTQGYNDVFICLGDGSYVELWDAKSGNVFNQPAEQRDGKLYVTTDFAAGEEKLYVLPNQKRQLPSKYERGAKLDIDLPGKWEYSLSEPNTCVLDYAEVQTDRGETIERCEILKVDRKLRELIGLPARGGEMLQPWYLIKKAENQLKALRTVSVCYDVTAAAVPKEVFLAVESLENMTGLKINGQPVSLVSSGKWIDICYDKIEIRPGILHRGSNHIEIDLLYDENSGLEAVYLLGYFGVSLAGSARHPVLTPLSKTLRLGDICRQGLPFYSGEISYELEPHLLREKSVIVILDNFEGACVKLLSGGNPSQLIAWPPFQADITDLLRSGDSLEIQLVLTRRNTFGPLHMLPARADAYGPPSFTTTGKSWTDEYMLVPQGLLEAPQFYRRDKRI
jgi:hypothetical protein